MSNLEMGIGRQGKRIQKWNDPLSFLLPFFGGRGLVTTGGATEIAWLAGGGRLGWARFSAGGGEKGGRPIKWMAARGNLMPARCGVAEGNDEKTRSQEIWVGGKMRGVSQFGQGKK